MIIKQEFSIHHQYNIFFTRDVFLTSNSILEDVLYQKQKESRVIAVVDQGLVRSSPDVIDAMSEYFHQCPNLHLLAPPLIVIGGEVVKNDRKEFDKVLSLIEEAKVDRHAFVVAIGGGAVLDMVGFAAAIGHRGIRHIRIPTTTLSQNDSGIGVKNGINYFGKKNFLGAFAPPHAVINDFTFLHTLGARDWRAGIAEAVKVAVIRDAEFFDWLEQNTTALSQRESSPMEKLIVRCAQLHAEHIVSTGDPFEMGSSRPLDFGHWAAHKLEQITSYQLRHGEAVAVGMALDLTYAAEVGYLAKKTANRICQVLKDVGFNLFHPGLLSADMRSINPKLLIGIEEFREHLGGELTITLISNIGEKFDVHEMVPEKIESAAISLLRQQQSYAH